MSSQNERLEFEDDDSRRARLGKLFGDLSSPAPATSTEGLSLPKDSESKPHAMPESDLLARVRAFLPEFQSSTQEIMRQAAENPDMVNLEKVGRGERAVAMDLGLGVYDAPGASAASAGGAGAAGTAGMGGLGPVVDTSDHPPQIHGESSDESEEDSEEEDEEETSEDEMDSASDADAAKTDDSE